jgi:hypothetical protein
MKGKRNINSLRSAVDDALANAKIGINALADEMRVNLKYYEDNAAEYQSAFRDLQQIITKPADDFSLIVITRIESEKKKEADKLQAMKDEEERKRQAVKPAPTDKSRHHKQVIQAGDQCPGFSAQAPASNVQSTNRPSDNEIIEVLALHYRVHESKVIEWLLDMDMVAATDEMVANI